MRICYKSCINALWFRLKTDNAFETCGMFANPDDTLNMLIEFVLSFSSKTPTDFRYFRNCSGKL